MLSCCCRGGKRSSEDLDLHRGWCPWPVPDATGGGRRHRAGRRATVSLLQSTTTMAPTPAREASGAWPGGGPRRKGAAGSQRKTLLFSLAPPKAQVTLALPWGADPLWWVDGWVRMAGWMLCPHSSFPGGERSTRAPAPHPPSSPLS